MIEWTLLALEQFIFRLICYITNPFIVLLADEQGELPEWAKYWQTYDNCLDIEWLISENIVPKFMQYDFNKHYTYYMEDKGDGYMIPGYVVVKDPYFTLKERVQRYLCRVWWLYRNTAYGFAYWRNGRYYLVDDTDILVDRRSGTMNRYYWVVSNDVWCIYVQHQWCRRYYLRLYLGWKLKGVRGYKHINRAMLAFHINPFRKVE